MTRARQTLSLLQFESTDSFFTNLNTTTAPFIERQVLTVSDHSTAHFTRKYVRLTLKDIYMDYAGCFAPQSPIHEALAQLRSGDELQVHSTKGRLALCNDKGIKIGQLAKSYRAPLGMKLVSARVTAVIERHRGDSVAEYQKNIKSDRWEVVIPELIYQ
jgi:ATP-dependent DNA helicase RecQ